MENDNICKCLKCQRRKNVLKPSVNRGCVTAPLVIDICRQKQTPYLSSEFAFFATFENSLVKFTVFVVKFPGYRILAPLRHCPSSRAWSTKNEMNGFRCKVHPLFVVVGWTPTESSWNHLRCIWLWWILFWEGIQYQCDVGCWCACTGLWDTNATEYSRQLQHLKQASDVLLLGSFNNYVTGQGEGGRVYPRVVTSVSNSIRFSDVFTMFCIISGFLLFLLFKVELKFILGHLVDGPCPLKGGH